MRERLAEIEIHQDDDGIVVARLHGEVDSSNATELRLALTEHLPSSVEALVLDLSGVPYFDSAGLHLLFELGGRLGARRQAMRLVVPESAPTRRVLELADIGAVAPLDPDLDDALRALRARR